MAESRIMREAMVALSKAGATFFRNNVGQAVIGQIEMISRPRTVTVAPGDAVVRNARIFHAGLVKGSSDLIGWHTVVVTPEMVGKRLAVFSAVETKDKGGRVQPEQRNFIDRLRLAGGFAGVAYSPAEAVAVLG